MPEDWDLSDDGLCSCGVRLGDHPPLPKPPPLASGHAARTGGTQEAKAAARAAAAKGGWNRMSLTRGTAKDDRSPLTADQQAVLHSWRRSPSEATVARVTGLSAVQVRRIMGRLRARGLA